MIYQSTDADADRFLILKDVAFGGLARLNRVSDSYHRGMPFERLPTICNALLADGELIEVKVESWKPVHYALGSDLETLRDLSAGRVPPEWTPLDPVSARGRANLLFGFEYIWEIYKPENQRKFGYYALPVLWEDRLVARFDSKFDRATSTFVILGFWLAEALACGMTRFMSRSCTVEFSR